MASPTHVVLRKFPGPGSVPLAPGTKVNASDWRTTERLVAQRFLRPLTESEIAAAGEPAGKGRDDRGRR